jgi:hypothetical protein
MRIVSAIEMFRQLTVLLALRLLAPLPHINRCQLSLTWRAHSHVITARRLPEEQFPLVETQHPPRQITQNRSDGGYPRRRCRGRKGDSR